MLQQSETDWGVRRAAGWGAVLALALADAGAAQPGPDLAAVAAWVAGELGAPAPAELPRIAFVAPAEMHRMRYGAATSAGTAPLAPVALYDDAARTIYLAEGWTGDTERDRSVLVHELAHHLQNLAGRKFGCSAEREAEAYALQDRWLARSGSSLEAAFEIDALTLLVMTRCPR